MARASRAGPAWLVCTSNQAGWPAGRASSQRRSAAERGVRRWCSRPSQASNSSGQRQAALQAGRGWAQCSSRGSGPRSASTSTGWSSAGGGLVPTRASSSPPRPSSARSPANCSARWGAASSSSRPNWACSCSNRSSQPATSVARADGIRRGRRNHQAPPSRTARLKPGERGRWLSRSRASVASHPPRAAAAAGSQGRRGAGMD